MRILALGEGVSRAVVGAAGAGVSPRPAGSESTGGASTSAAAALSQPTLPAEPSAARAPALRRLPESLRAYAQTALSAARRDGWQRPDLTTADLDRLSYRLKTAPAPTVAALRRLCATAHAAAPTPQAKTLAAALVLRAAAARPNLDATALAQLDRFAKGLAGLSEDTLRSRSTLLDRKPNVATSNLNIVALMVKSPTGPLPRRDLRAHDDGLLQTFDSSCGPTSLQALKGDLDPLFAFAVHAQGGPQSMRWNNPAVREQATGIRQFGDVPRQRRGMFDYRRLKVLTQKLVDRGALSGNARLALLTAARGGSDAFTADATAALTVVRQSQKTRPAFPSATDLQRMRASSPAATTAGSDTRAFLRWARQVFEPHLGAELVSIAGRDSRFIHRQEKTLVAAAQSGGAILGTSDHWWAICDAQHLDGALHYLMHDPWTGITNFVPATELADGSFSRTRFGWREKSKITNIVVAAPRVARA